MDIVWLPTFKENAIPREAVDRPQKVFLLSVA